LKNRFKDIVQAILDSELEQHLSYEKHSIQIESVVGVDPHNARLSCRARVAFQHCPVLPAGNYKQKIHLPNSFYNPH